MSSSSSSGGFSQSVAMRRHCFRAQLSSSTVDSSSSSSFVRSFVRWFVRFFSKRLETFDECLRFPSRNCLPLAATAAALVASLVVGVAMALLLHVRVSVERFKRTMRSTNSLIVWRAQRATLPAYVNENTWHTNARTHTDTHTSTESQAGKQTDRQTLAAKVAGRRE